MAFAPRNSAPKTTRRQRDLRRAVPTPSRAAPRRSTARCAKQSSRSSASAPSRASAAAARARGKVAYRTSVMLELADDDETTEPDDFWVDDSRPKAPPPPVQPWLEDTIPAEADVVQMKEDVDLDPLAPANFPQWPLPSNSIRELCAVCRVDLKTVSPGTSAPVALLRQDVLSTVPRGGTEPGCPVSRACIATTPTRS